MILRRIAKGIKDQDWFVVMIEIMIVVVGIYIGLQVDDWNKDREKYAQETVILTEIATDLKENVEKIKATIAKDERSIEGCNFMIPFIENAGDWTKKVAREMEYCRTWTSPFIVSASYDSYKTQGTHMISNPTLRNEIIRVFDNNFNYLVNDTDKYFWSFSTQILLPYGNKHLRLTERDHAYPVDYVSLQKDVGFMNMIYRKIDIQTWSLETQYSSKEAAERVIALIETELEARGVS